MADSDKNILITPNRGSSNDPKIEFTGGDNDTVQLTVLDDGTLSFSGSAGQLFSISNDLTGTIFSVNDISGIPSIEVEDDGTVTLAEFAGNVLIGTNVDSGDKLQVNGVGSFTGLTVDGYNVAYTNYTNTATSKTLAVNEKCLVTASGRTITLPANPTEDDIVGVIVENFTDTIVARNGSSIMELAEDLTIDKEYASLDFLYQNGSWRIV